MASLRRFWLFESSELLASDCLELAEPKQPIAENGVHQQAVVEDAPPSGAVSGDSVVPLDSALRASLQVTLRVFSLFPRFYFVAVLFSFLRFFFCIFLANNFDANITFLFVSILFLFLL